LIHPIAPLLVWAFVAQTAHTPETTHGPTRKPQVIEDAAETELPSLDLEGYFADGPFEAAQKMVARGDTRQAVQLLKRLLKDRSDAPERPQARYLLGLSLIQLEEYEEAARLFDELATSYPLLKDDHLFFRGQALYLWGSYLDAADALAAVDVDGPRGEEARRLRAWALLRATAFDRLVRWLEGLEKKEQKLDPELLFVLARARHRTGDVLGAYRAFREVWREVPGGKLAGPALVNIAELKIGDKPMLSESERAAVLSLEKRLSSSSDVDGAMKDLEKRLERAPGSNRLRAEVAYARGRIAQLSGRLRTADGHYERAMQAVPVEVSELRARIGLEQARVVERLGEEQRALALYVSVSERFSERPEAEDALFHAAEILLSARKYREAKTKLQALMLKNPVTPYRPRALWGIGWAHFRLAEHARAHEFFSSLSNMKLPADLAAASHYWLARTEASLKNPEKARLAYVKVLENHPLTHYAALAEDQLTEAFLDPVVEPSAKRSGPEDQVKKELIQVREYMRLGLRARALETLVAYERATKKAGKREGESTFYAIARVYDELGKSAEARRVREECSRDYPRSLGDEEFIAVARRAHPLKFEEPIRAAAEEHGLSDSLLFALIRTESGFRPDAVSNMDAYGLAQLILPTAQSMAAQLKAGRATRSRLLRDPVFNVRLGAAYLRYLLDRYDGSEPLALAAYNAGPNAVDAWLAMRVRRVEGVGDAGKGVGVMPAPDELAEEIPVRETRAFVKAVLARARGYARLYPRETKEPEIPQSPLVEVGASHEPSDLARPVPEDRVRRGSRVVGETWVRIGEQVTGVP
jgi:soluble lytic murein transglycosylase